MSPCVCDGDGSWWRESLHSCCVFQTSPAKVGTIATGSCGPSTRHPDAVMDGEQPNGHPWPGSRSRDASSPRRIFDSDCLGHAVQAQPVQPRTQEADLCAADVKEHCHSQ